MTDQPEESKKFEDVSRPIPESNMAYQELVLKSTLMPTDPPEELKNPPNPEDLIYEEDD